MPRRLLHPKRRTIGIRIPDNQIVQAMLDSLQEPMLSTTLIMPGEHLPLTVAEEIRERLEHDVDLVIDGGHCGLDPTTVVDLTEHEPRVTRVGCGDPEPFMAA